MRKLLFFLAVVATCFTANAQTPPFGEFFLMSRMAADPLYSENPVGSGNFEWDGRIIHYYDSIQRMAEERGLIYLMYYEYSNEQYNYAPPLPEDHGFVYNRYFHLGATSSTPNGFIMGRDVLRPFYDNTQFVVPYRWDRWLNEPYTVTPVIEEFDIKKYPLINILTAKIRIDGPVDANSHLLVILSENFPEKGDKHVFRQRLHDGIYTGGTIECATVFHNEYVRDNCELTVVIEDDATGVRKVLGALQEPFKNEAGEYWSISRSTGIDDSNLTKLSVYPNPCTDNLYIESATNISSVKVTAITGQTFYHEKVAGYRVNVDMKDYPSGIYFVTVPGKTMKVYKQ